MICCLLVMISRTSCGTLWAPRPNGAIAFARNRGTFPACQPAPTPAHLVRLLGTGADGLVTASLGFAGADRPASAPGHALGIVDHAVVDATVIDTG